MMEKALSRSIRLICLGGMAFGMHAAAIAQEAEQPITKVTVTGSRISTPGAESPSPLQVLSAEDIAQSGATNVQELLLENPTMGTPAISRTNSNFSTASAGVATVDLRNMGTARTLVLINGRRVVAGVPGSSAVDLNTIPTDFVERIELLTGGASATYGSDAVAGVVNIILKRNFSGVLFDGSLGESSEGDDKKKKLALTFGTTSADGASNVMGHLGWSRQGAVMSRDRDMSAVDQISQMLFTGNPADAYKVRQPFYSSYAPQGTFYNDNGGFTYDANGNLVSPSTNGSATRAPTGFNRSHYRTIAVPTDRFLLATSGNLAIAEDHSAFFEGTYASTKVSTELEPYPLGSESIYPIDGQVPAEFNVGGTMMRNPYIPQSLYDGMSDTNGDGARDYYFTRRMSEFGNRGSTANRDTFRLASGLKGSLFDWNYEAYAVYGATKEGQESGGQVNVLNFRHALEAVTDVNDLNGNGSTTDVICADATARAQGCVPVNVFGAGAVSAAAAQYIAAPGSLTTDTTQKLVGGSVNGEPFSTPAGAVGVAAGFEWRRETSSSVPDALTQAGLNAGNATPPTYGSFDVREAFVEARVPLLADAPFAKNLNFTGAFRAGDYSTVGRTNSWNAGLEWAPVSDIKLRATRALSTRAPNINELYSPPSQDFPTGIQDPCVGVTATSTGTYDAACRAAPGVMANITANGAFTLNQSDIQGVSGYNRGNPNLGAEKGRSTTVGVVITPRSIPMLSKFTATIDYFDINIADAIVGTPRNYMLKQCYSGDTQWCQFITRRPAAAGANSSGSLEYIDTTVSNSGGAGTEGVDVTLTWADQVGPGRLNARLAYTHVMDGYSIPLPGAKADPWHGEVGAARNKGTLGLGYKWGKFNVTSSTTVIGSSSLDDTFRAKYETATAKIDKVKTKVYNDLQLTYSALKSTDVYFGIDNVLDTKAPLIPSGLPGSDTGTETNAGTYDPIGRRFYVGVRVKL